MNTIKILLMTGVILFSQISVAAGTQYDIRVDGLACPFCAYGIEKGFVQSKGVDSVDIDLVKGLVIVKTQAGKTYTADELKEIVNDTGFTMKSMTEKAL